MSEYIDVVRTDKQFKGNIVIQIGSDYFAIRQPDSGLVIAAPYAGAVMALTLNPTQIDIARVTTTISSFGFKISDKQQIVTALVLGDARNLLGVAVRVFLGRTNHTGNSDKNMAFSDYFELPTVYIKKAEFDNGAYSFTATEQTERMAKPIYDLKAALDGDILAATTEFTMRDSIADFPNTGFLKVENEFVSYGGKDLINNRFTSVVRGELGSTPADHDANNDCVLAETVTGNPLDIILKILISGGGGGVYDVLDDGLGIDEDLVDIAEIEALRDEQFVDVEVELTLCGLESALRFMEEQLLMPHGLRFTTSLNSKLSLAQLDKARFVEEDNVIDHESITKHPKWFIDGNKVTNEIIVNWDYNDGTNVFQERTTFEDAASIALYGRQTLTYDFKGPKADLDGDLIVNDFGTRLLTRLAYPTPEVQVTTQLDKSLQTIGDKAYLVSDKVPAATGTLDFSSDLEIISRAINQTNGDVTFRLAFTSFTNIRTGFIAPSALIESKTSQSVLGVPTGQGAKFLVGQYMRLWNMADNEYEADDPNKITRITGDTIEFENDWTTVITTPNNYRIRFTDYDTAVASQKRYGFISDGGANFDDGKPTYRITY